jgi:hypothetical protein
VCQRSGRGKRREGGAEERARHWLKSVVWRKHWGLGSRLPGWEKETRYESGRLLLTLSEMVTDMETYNAPMRLAASIQTICSMQCGISKISRSPRATPHARNTYAATTLWWSSCRREMDGHAAASAPGRATCSLNASSGTVTKAFSQPVESGNHRL